MKKMLLTGAMALMGLMVSAQSFMVTADIDMDDPTNFEGVTETLGFGYFVNDAFVVGAKMAGDEDFNVFVRYYWNDNVFLSATAPTEEMMDNLTVGAGYTFGVTDMISVEPNVSTALQTEDGVDRELTFGLGVAFNF